MPKRPQIVAEKLREVKEKLPPQKTIFVYTPADKDKSKLKAYLRSYL